MSSTDGINLISENTNINNTDKSTNLGSEESFSSNKSNKKSNKSNKPNGLDSQKLDSINSNSQNSLSKSLHKVFRSKSGHSHSNKSHNENNLDSNLRDSNSTTLSDKIKHSTTTNNTAYSTFTMVADDEKSLKANINNSDNLRSPEILKSFNNFVDDSTNNKKKLQENDGDFDSIFSGKKTMTEAIIQHHTQPRNNTNNNSNNNTNINSSNNSISNSNDKSDTLHRLFRSNNNTNHNDYNHDNKKDNKNVRNLTVECKQQSRSLTSLFSRIKKNNKNSSPLSLRNDEAITNNNKHEDKNVENEIILNTKNSDNANNNDNNNNNDVNSTAYDIQESERQSISSLNNRKKSSIFQNRKSLIKKRLLGSEFSSTSAPILINSDKDKDKNSRISVGIYSRNWINGADDIDDMTSIGIHGVSQSSSSLTNNNFLKETIIGNSLDADSVLLGEISRNSIVSQHHINNNNNNGNNDNEGASINSPQYTLETPLSSSLLTIPNQNQFFLPKKGGDIDDFLKGDPEPIADIVASIPKKLRDVDDLVEKDIKTNNHNNHSNIALNNNTSHLMMMNEEDLTRVSTTEAICLTMNDNNNGDINQSIGNL